MMASGEVHKLCPGDLVSWDGEPEGVGVVVIADYNRLCVWWDNQEGTTWELANNGLMVRLCEHLTYKGRAFKA